MCCVLLAAVAFTIPIRAEKLQRFEQDGMYGYKTPSGQVRLPARYIMAEEFNAHGFAVVVENTGPFLIDQKGAHRFQIFLFDNGPDPFSGGLARFVEKGRIGFFNEKGEIVIPASFDFARPFESAYTAACMGCKSVREERGEHSMIKGGKWIVIDKKGNRVLKTEFDESPALSKTEALGVVNGRKTFVRFQELPVCTASLDKCVNKRVKLTGRLAPPGEIMQHAVVPDDLRPNNFYLHLKDRMIVLYAADKDVRCDGTFSADGTLISVTSKEGGKPYSAFQMRVDSWSCGK